MNRRDREDIPQERDRHLDIPAEANRDKHVNFLEEEELRNDRDAADTNSPFYIPNNTPLKNPNTGGGNQA